MAGADTMVSLERLIKLCTTPAFSDFPLKHSQACKLLRDERKETCCVSNDPLNYDMEQNVKRSNGEKKKVLQNNL